MTSEPPSSWSKIQRLALSVNGYEEAGSFERCADIAHDLRSRCEREGVSVLDAASTDHLRWSLFFEQRSWRHHGVEPGDHAMAYLRSIVAVLGRRVALP